MAQPKTINKSVEQPKFVFCQPEPNQRDPWQDLSESTSDFKPFPSDYLPKSVEIFDQNGLIAGLVNGENTYYRDTKVYYIPDFLAWYLDGKLALFLVGKIVLFNRMQRLNSRNTILRYLEGTL